LAEKIQREQARAVMRKRAMLTQTSLQDLEWKYAITPNPIGRSEVDKQARDIAGPERKPHSSHQEREKSGNFLTWATFFFQFLWDSESDIQRRVNKMDGVGPPTSHSSCPKANVSFSV